MTKDAIITEFYGSKNFNDCINKMEPDYLRDDLKAEVMLVICDMPFEGERGLFGLHQRRELHFYVARIIFNMIKSSTSPFYKKYRMLNAEIANDDKY